MKRLVDLFLSLKLTVTLLALSMVLIFVGTLAQVDKGIWTVMDQYFRCWIAWIELSVFSEFGVGSGGNRPVFGRFSIGFITFVEFVSGAFIHL